MSTIDGDQLLDSAKDYADHALRAYVEGQNKRALTDAAVSLEHLSKAVLCSIQPVLLVELKNGSFDSLLHLAGEGSRSKKPPKDVRTISGSEAIARVQLVVPGITVPPERIKQLIALRNGVLHAGQFDAQDVHQLLAAYVRLGNRLFEELDVSDDARWGDHRTLVESVISETLDEVERDVRRRMVQAKYHFDDLVSKIPPEQLPSLMNALQVAAGSLIAGKAIGIEVRNTACPVCKHGAASCKGWVDILFSERIEDDLVVAVDREWAMIAEIFVCGVCDLRLHSSDELEAAGLDAFIRLPDYELPDDDGFLDEGPWMSD
ncbi:hypothetical protein [Actinomadura opuntiae]|uniref:hypothetical protein n=1 Tax=Actinomadura sp. OS1-43 TaxID=604315 RepID=UPI00255AAE63|nr:hypothetical protein [Actinomadura sp. OS1-43]MDL4815990.1 hypothetical protein [Actinomadura sp. OS1-43]